MAEGLLFCVIKELDTYIAGKILQVKLLSGSVSVGDGVSLYCIDLDKPRRKCSFNRIDGVIKQIKSLDAGANEFEETANRGDIVTINLSKQCSLDGKKVDKNDIVTKNSTIGVAQGDPCDGVNLLRLNFRKCGGFIEKLRDSLEKNRRHENNNLTKEPRACVVSLLWFGKKVAAEVKSITAFDTISTQICFRLLNDQALPIPQSHELRKYVMRVVVKDHYKTEQRGRNKSGEAKWRYYPSEIFFDD